MTEETKAADGASAGVSDSTQLLAPCPFCGKELATFLSSNEITDCDECGNDRSYTVVCDSQKGGCGGSSGYDTDKGRAVNNWNMRANVELSGGLEMHGTLNDKEPHQAGFSAREWIFTKGPSDLLLWQESFSSCAIEGDRLSEICRETLRRLLEGEPVSDRYLLGLAWVMVQESNAEVSREGDR